MDNINNIDPDEKISYFGLSDTRGKKTKFGIKAKDRTKHLYVIGKTGMGKSTLLENMAVQDIQNGEGLAVIDPHGSMAETLLDYIPEDRIKDVLYFAPFDMEHPISFNVMEDVDADKRHLVASGLMSVFEKTWEDAWSARMAYILNNTILALLEYPDATLLGINRMMSDKSYQKKVVDNVTDPSVRSFWVDEFAKYNDRYAVEATAAIQNKIGQYTSTALMRNIIGQSKSSFDIRDIMDKRKILIINLSKGRVGESNANLLGSMLITKIYLAAMSRADVSAEDIKKLPQFYLYVDEFQSFANKSFADILSEARKYKLNLTIAHQYIEQMSEEVRAAVFGNVGTMISFRVGAYDAEVLEKEYAPTFTAQDLVNLGFAQIYLKLMINGVSSMPFSAITLPPIEHSEQSFKKQTIQWSREHFGKPRALVEEKIQEWHKPITPPASPKPKVKVSEKPIGASAHSKSRPTSVAPTPASPIKSAPPKTYSAPPFKPSAPRVPQKQNANVTTAPPNKRVVGTPSVSAPQNRPSPTTAPEKSISLSELKKTSAQDNAQRSKKEPTKEHLSELKSALSSVIKSAKEEKQTQGEEKKEAQPETRAPQQNQQPESQNQKNEIPEDTLRKMLDVEK